MAIKSVGFDISEMACILIKLTSFQWVLNPDKGSVLFHIDKRL